MGPGLQEDGLQGRLPADGATDPTRLAADGRAGHRSARPQLAELPQAARTLTSGPGALAQPFLPVRPVAPPPATVDPFRPVRAVEHGDVGEAALFEALQFHALATAHFRQIGEREDQGLDVFPDRRDVVARHPDGGQHVPVQYLFAAPLLGQQFVFRGYEAIAGL